jgi:alpha-D-ribose 1-methylphosphonate 5-triphosphate synthase subunit PhnH
MVTPLQPLHIKKKLLLMPKFSYTVFDFKTVYRTWHNGVKRPGQKLKILPPTKPQDNFASSVQVV